MNKQDKNKNKKKTHKPIKTIFKIYFILSYMVMGYTNQKTLKDYKILKVYYYTNLRLLGNSIILHFYISHFWYI